MKDLYFTSDLMAVLRHDTYYGNAKNLNVALRKFGLPVIERTDDTERMYHALTVQIMDQGGESEPFLAGAFIYPEVVIKLLKAHGLPAPTALTPASTTKINSSESIDRARFEQIFDTVCRNCGTVTDPLARAYRTPIGRLIFKTYLTTRLTLGINTTAKYVLEHLKEFDSDKAVAAVNEDGVIWKTEDGKEKITSIQTIDKFVMNFNRELKTLL